MTVLSINTLQMGMRLNAEANFLFVQRFTFLIAD